MSKVVEEVMGDLWDKHLMKNLGVKVEGALVEAVTLVDKDGMRTGLNISWCVA